MRLKQIQDFIAVVEAGSIHAAARRVGVSQPAITKSVRGLEAELHVQLVRRTNHGVVPTPAGKAFFTRAHVANAELRKAKEEVSQLEAGAAGSVAFGVGPVAALLILPEAVPRFRERFPAVRVRVLEGLTHALMPLVRDESLDFAIGPRPNAKLDPALAFRPLFQTQFVVVARKGHPLGNARSLAQLADADWLSLWSRALPSGPLDQAFSRAKLPPPRQVVQCESYHTMVAMLARTDMLGMMGSRLLVEPFARDLLKKVPVDDTLPAFTVGMFLRADVPLTSVATAMAKAVTTAARLLARPA